MARQKLKADMTEEKEAKGKAAEAGKVESGRAEAKSGEETVVGEACEGRKETVVGQAYGRHVDTVFAEVDPERVDSGASAAAIEKAAEIIRRGGLVAFPTETVYGLGGDAENRAASRMIYAAKGRPSDNPLIVHIASVDQLKAIATDFTEDMQRLADAFWPGPLTVIVNSNGKIPKETTGGLSTVAVRFPSHPVANALIRASGRMIAAPSANTSGRPSPTTAAHVAEDLTGRVDMILDGGPVNIGLESTIVDLSEGTPTILRPGYITRGDVERVLGTCAVDPGITKENVHVRPKAPGMRYRHYAPKADLTIVEGGREAVIAAMVREAKAAADSGLKTAVICSTETVSAFREAGLPEAAVEIIDIGSEGDDEEIAANLFAVLRRCDDDGISRVFSESFENGRIGGAIMNRLTKAAGHDIRQV